MKSTGNLSLSNSYKYLQRRMWEISQKASQLNKENEILKGRVSTQRVMIKKRKVQTSYAKRPDQEQSKNTVLNKNFEECCKVNLRLKQKITVLEEQRKQIMEKIGCTQKLQKKHRKLEINLQKYAKKLRKMRKQEEPVAIQNQFGKQHQSMNETIHVCQREESELKANIRNTLAQLEEQKRYNKLLSSQILGLIEQKNQMKKRIKAESTNKKK